jgi:hypothetical protein
MFAQLTLKSTVPAPSGASGVTTSDIGEGVGLGVRVEDGVMDRVPVPLGVSDAVAVGDGVAVAVGVCVAELEPVGVPVSDGVLDTDGSAPGDSVAEALAVCDGVCEAEGVPVGELVGVVLLVAVEDAVLVAVAVCEPVGVGVLHAIGEDTQRACGGRGQAPAWRRAGWEAAAARRGTAGASRSLPPTRRHAGTHRIGRGVPDHHPDNVLSLVGLREGLQPRSRGGGEERQSQGPARRQGAEAALRLWAPATHHPAVARRVARGAGHVTAGSASERRHERRVSGCPATRGHRRSGVRHVGSAPTHAQS